jgi:hypothetical protein
LGLGATGNDALVDTGKLFILGTETHGLVHKELLHCVDINAAWLLIRSLDEKIIVHVAWTRNPMKANIVRKSE